MMSQRQADFRKEYRSRIVGCGPIQSVMDSNREKEPAYLRKSAAGSVSR